MKLNTKIINNKMFSLTTDYLFLELNSLLDTIASDGVDYLLISVECEYLYLDLSGEDIQSTIQRIPYTPLYLTDYKLQFIKHILVEYGKVLGKLLSVDNSIYPNTLLVKYYNLSNAN